MAGAEMPVRHDDGLSESQEAQMKTIAHVADERGADLVVVGTREPGLLARLLGQSVSGAVQRKAHCNVLIVHEQRGGAV
jgi:nucleotide-binding universal stress UspA family protein